MDFETAGTKKSIINHIETVGHTNEQDIVELINTVHFGEKLVDNTISNTSSSRSRATLFTNGIQFVENDDMESTLIAFFFILLKCKQADGDVTDK